MYDGRIGRWLSTDPKGQFASPYEGMGNNPVNGFDPTGGEDGDGPDDWYLPKGVTDQSKAIYIPGSNAVSGYTDIGPDNMNFQGGALQTVNVNSTYIYNWLGMNPGVESWDSDKNPYMLKNAELQNAAKNEALFLSIFIGGELVGGGSAAFSYSSKALTTRAGISLTAQLLSKGVQKLDFADVTSETFLPLGLSSISDAEVDFQPFIPTGPVLGIGGYNKDMGKVEFEATTNLIMGTAVGSNGAIRDAINNGLGQGVQDKIEQSIWKE